MVFVGIAIYKKSTKKSILDLVFATLLFIESLITCGIVGDFDLNLHHQLILSI